MLRRHLVMGTNSQVTLALTASIIGADQSINDRNITIQKYGEVFPQFEHYITVE